MSLTERKNVVSTCGMNPFYQSFSNEVRKAKRSCTSDFRFMEGFSGPGGMSLGLQRAGFELVYAFDIAPKAVETHNLNLGNHAEERDAREVCGSELLNRFGLKRRELDLFAGGPPCQGFSKQKKGAHLGDKRNDLVLDYIRIVNEIKPKMFFFENVAVFGQKRGREFLRAMHNSFDEYLISAYFLNSANFGLAQTRQRFVVVGKRFDIKSPFILPERIVDEWKTVKDVIGDLPEPPKDFSPHRIIANHQRARVTQANIDRFAHVPPGGGWQDIPRNMQLACHQKIDVQSGGWPDVFGRLKWDGQCPTITGGFDSFTRGRYGHPSSNRPLTPREAARLQGFPDDFVFVGTRGDVRSQIGNAVPPPLAETVGISIARTLLSELGYIRVNEPAKLLLENLASPYMVSTSTK